MRSPSSCVLNSCCNRRCSDATVRLMSSVLSPSKGLVAGGESIRSRTSAAYSGERDETTYSNFVFCADILLVVNCASICANHSSGSAGQKGGSLMEMALAAATGGGSMGSASMGSTMGGSVGSGIETFVCCQGSPM